MAGSMEANALGIRVRVATRFSGLSERSHARFGCRSVLIWVGSMWAIGLPMVVAGPFVFHDFAHLTTGATALLMAGFAGTWLLCVGAILLEVYLLIRPVRVFEDNPDQATAAEAWRAVVALPRKFTLWAVPAALIPGVVGGLWSVATVVQVSLPLLILGAIATSAGTFAMISAAAIAIPVVTRPVLREIAPYLDKAALPTSISLRVLRLLLPMIGVVAAVAGSAFSLRPGDQREVAYLHLGLAAAVAALVSIPASAILAHVLIEPIRELLATVERIREGDYSQSIGAQTTREFGVLADAFNEVMTGLAERRHFEETNLELLGEVRASRARIVTAGYEARRKVGRDLHDGAQSLLLALAFRLRLIQEETQALGAEHLAAEMEACIESVRAVVGEVRELARGVHPTVLATDGLGPALEQLAALAPIPVQVSASGERFPEALELTLYFVTAEAITNAVKHAEATVVQVEVRRGLNEVRVLVSDDGGGGAHIVPGSGLAGLADRVAALGGDLEVLSPQAQGTRLMCRLPMEDEY